jgi:hypothetical protein
MTEKKIAFLKMFSLLKPQNGLGALLENTFIDTAVINSGERLVDISLSFPRNATQGELDGITEQLRAVYAVNGVNIKYTVRTDENKADTGDAVSVMRPPWENEPSDAPLESKGAPLTSAKNAEADANTAGRAAEQKKAEAPFESAAAAAGPEAAPAVRPDSTDELSVKESGQQWPKLRRKAVRRPA